MSRMTDPKIVSTRSMDEESVISILASTSDLDSLSELSTKSDPGEPGTIPLRSPQPLYFPVRQTELCWRCGEAGHQRFTCRGKPTLFFLFEMRAQWCHEPRLWLPRRTTGHQQEKAPKEESA